MREFRKKIICSCVLAVLVFILLPSYYAKAANTGYAENYLFFSKGKGHQNDMAEFEGRLDTFFNKNYNGSMSQIYTKYSFEESFYKEFYNDGAWALTGYGENVVPGYFFDFMEAAYQANDIDKYFGSTVNPLTDYIRLWSDIVDSEGLSGIKEYIQGCALRAEIQELKNNADGSMVSINGDVYKDSEGHEYNPDADFDKKAQDQYIIDKSLGTTNGLKGISKLIVNAFVDLICLLADGLNDILENANLSLDAILFGRVGGHGAKLLDKQVSFVTFEMKEGNIYGNVGAVFYDILREISYLLMATFGAFCLFRAAFRDSQMDTKSGILLALKNVAVCMAFVAFMPALIDLLLYIRDVLLLQTVGSVINIVSKGESQTLIDAFAQNARNAQEYSNGLLDACGYLSAVVLSLALACMYVGLALEMMLMFVMFPLNCVLAVATGSLDPIKKWFGKFLGCALTPVFDGFLLSVVVAILGAKSSLAGIPKSNYVSAMSALNFIALFAMFSFMALRKVVREQLGLSESAIAETGLQFAKGALSVGAAVGRTAAKSAGVLAEGLGQANQDYADGKYYEDLAAAEAEVQKVAGQNASVDTFTKPEVSRELNDAQKAARYTERAQLGEASGGFEGDFEGGFGGSNPDTDMEMAAFHEMMGKTKPLVGEAASKAAMSGNVSPDVLKNMSSAQKAEAYKKRARSGVRKTIAKTLATGASGIGMGALAAGGSLFLGADTAGQAFAAGNSVGNDMNSYIDAGKELFTAGKWMREEQEAENNESRKASAESEAEQEAKATEVQADLSTDVNVDQLADSEAESTYSVELRTEGDWETEEYQKKTDKINEASQDAVNIQFGDMMVSPNVPEEQRAYEQARLVIDVHCKEAMSEAFQNLYKDGENDAFTNEKYWQEVSNVALEKDVKGYYKNLFSGLVVRGFSADEATKYVESHRASNDEQIRDAIRLNPKVLEEMAKMVHPEVTDFVA